jgi:hypothetical protein
VVEEQLTAMLYSGLLDDPRLVRVACFVTANDVGSLGYMKAMLGRWGRKVVVVAESLDTQTFERFTLEKLKGVLADEPDETAVLYLHSKGVSQTEVETIANVACWTRALCYHLIGKYRVCLTALDNAEHSADIVGAFYSADPLPHFQGNFWWARHSYIKKLPDTIGSGYLEPELNFVFCASPRWKAIASVPDGIQDLYKEPLWPAYYAGETAS